VRSFNNRADVLQAAAAEEHQGNRHQYRGVVDRIHQPIDRRADAAIRWNVDDFGAVPLQALEQIVIRRKIEILQHDLAPLALERKTRGDDGLRHGRVLVHRDRILGDPENRREQIAGVRADRPPALVPRAHPRPSQSSANFSR
jgi:hypothetical protein